MERPVETFMEKVPEITIILAEKEIEEEPKRAAGVALFSAIYIAFGTEVWEGGYRSLSKQDKERMLKFLKFARSKALEDWEKEKKNPDRMFILAMANVWSNMTTPLSERKLASQEMKNTVKEAIKLLESAKREANRVEDLRGNLVYDFGSALTLYYFTPESEIKLKQQAMRKLKKLARKGNSSELGMVAQAFLADINARRGNFREVIRICYKLRRRTPKVYHIPRAMSHAYRCLGRLDKAKEMMLEAQKLGANDPQVMLDLAKFSLTEGDIKQAESFVSKARKSKIANKFSHEVAGITACIEIERGNLRQAKEVLEEALSL